MSEFKFYALISSILNEEKLSKDTKHSVRKRIMNNAEIKQLFKD